MIRRLLSILLGAAAVLSASCAARLAPLPSGAGTPFPDAATAYAGATAACRDIRTLAAILTISGRAAGTRFPRAKLDAGFEAPGKIVLELPAPGRPIFTFAASANAATLVLPREGRVLQNAPPAETLEALAGVSLGPDELRTIVTGCGFGPAEPSSPGRSFDGNLVAVESGQAITYLQRTDTGWRVSAATRGDMEIRYADFADGRPSTIRLRTAPADNRSESTDLTIRISQVDINQPIDPSAFVPEVPAGATPLTLEELRQAGPLGR